MAFAGVRPAVIGDLHGNNGLTLGDIEGISIEKNTVTVEPPLKVTIPENLSKTSYKYFTFLCEEEPYIFGIISRSGLRMGKR